MGLIKPWFVSDGRDDPVWQEIREHERYRADVYRPWIQAGRFTALPGEPQPIDQSYLVGSPSEVAERLHALREVMPVTDLIGWGTPVGTDPAAPAVRRSLERFAAEVMPQFRERE